MYRTGHDEWLSTRPFGLKRIAFHDALEIHDTSKLEVWFGSPLSEGLQGLSVFGKRQPDRFVDHMVVE
jgi:hypothetical protein